MTVLTPGTQQRPLRTEQAPLAASLQSYEVVLPLDVLDEQGTLLDWVIDFAFDTLDARRLDLRIVAPTYLGG